MLLLALLLPGAASAQAPAGPHGKVTGKLLAADSGEPLGFADVALIPLGVAAPKPIGTMTNADGTFTLEAPPGTYTLSARAISYANKSVAGVVVSAGATKEISLSLASDAIEQETVVVEGKLELGTEGSDAQSPQEGLERRRRRERRGSAQVARPRRRRRPQARHRHLAPGRQVRLRARDGRALQLDRDGLACGSRAPSRTSASCRST
jgi:hypothetical protein